MTQQTFQREVERVLQIPAGSLRRDQTIRDLEHWDSLKLLEILILAEEQYGTVIDEDRLAQCVTVGDVLTLVETPKRPSRSTDSEPPSSSVSHR
jgi:acyl carrier protein